MNDLQKKLSKYRVILGSQSPRRSELLRGLDIQFQVIVKDTDESFSHTIPLHEVPGVIAKKKFDAFVPELFDTDFLITADTVVIKDNAILQKPKDLHEAKQIVTQLSHGVHTVVTGVCFGTVANHVLFSAQTHVTFASLSESDIDYYIHTYNPLDKAGAYGVQEWIGYVGISHIEGSYYNVMGLPVQALYQKILAYED